MAMSLRTSARTALAQAIISDAGNGAKIKLYATPIPSGVAAATGTLLATLTQGGSSPLGTASNGAIDFDEAGFTQTASNHVTGTAAFVHITTSADVVVARIDIGAGAGNWQISGNVVNGQAVSLVSLVIAAGNV